MKYNLEIFYEGECIESREYEKMIIPPDNGDTIHVEFQNKAYSEEHGNLWVVNKKRHFLFDPTLNMQKLRLYCEPAKKNE